MDAIYLYKDTKEMAMRVEDLRYFEHLSKVLNFTRASKDLHISQPTLSLAVKRLEDEWGVQLLERNRATVELTDIGHDIVECISSALYDLDRAQTLAEESLGPKTRLSTWVLYMRCRENFGHRPCSTSELKALSIRRLQ